LFGTPETAGGGGGGSSWSRGKFQKLLSLAMDVPEMEKQMCGPADIHERLNEEVGKFCKFCSIVTLCSVYNTALTAENFCLGF
jgi:hypothetical protein